jgi:RIO-like serine/threonine protein kinase
MSDEIRLKKDLFGEVWLKQGHKGPVVLRDTGPARWWTRWIARYLLRREVSILAVLEGMRGVPQLLEYDRDILVRTYLSGAPMHIAQPREEMWFDAAAALLRRLHRVGVCHNDLAKEPNVLVQEDGTPAFIDFQLAWYSRRRGRLFRIAAYEDIRHLLKHKRTYRADCLTSREVGILANPSPLSRLWMSTAKPMYLFVTRRLLGWSDREGAGDRGSQQ